MGFGRGSLDPGPGAFIRQKEQQKTDDRQWQTWTKRQTDILSIPSQTMCVSQLGTKQGNEQTNTEIKSVWVEWAQCNVKPIIFFHVFVCFWPPFSFSPSPSLSLSLPPSLIKPDWGIIQRKKWDVMLCSQKTTQFYEKKKGRDPADAFSLVTNLTIKVSPKSLRSSRFRTEVINQAAIS